MKHVLAFVLLTQVAAQPLPPDWRDEFPPEDYEILGMLAAGYQAADAAERLRRAPADVETVRALVDVEHYDAVLRSLRLIVDEHPARMAAAFEAVREPLHSLGGEKAQDIARRERLRQILNDGRRKLGDLPREDAARAEYAFVQIENSLWGDSFEQSRRLLAFSINFRGTDAALLAEVDWLVGHGPSDLNEIAELDAFIAEHPGTTAAAKAIYSSGFAFSSGNLLHEGPDAADPIRRFERVQAAVRELESGRYPASEWTRRAPDLIEGFFLPDDARIAPHDLDRMISAVEAHVRRRVESVERPERDLAYLITSELPELYARRGYPDLEFERFMSTLERSSAAQDAAQLLRATYYLQRRESETPQSSDVRTGRARTTLRAFAAAGNSARHRQALARIATLEIGAGQCAAALKTLREYLDRYPRSPWSWVAWIRTGQCEEILGDFSGAIAAFRRAADAGDGLRPARVLGRAHAARLLRATGAMREARDQYKAALDAWDDNFGDAYVASADYPFGVEGAHVFDSRTATVSKQEIRHRAAVLTQALATPAGVVLEHAHARFERDDFESAEALAARFLNEQPNSPEASDARYVLHMATLQQAIALATAPADADRGRATRMLDELVREPYDFAVMLARIARASLRWNEGIDRAAQEQELKAAFTEWQMRQVPRDPQPGIEEDLAAIREAVFRPQGGGVYADYWAQYSWPDATAPFLIVNPDLRVSLDNDEFETFTIAHRLPDADRILFLNDTQLELLADLSFALRMGSPRKPEGDVSETVTLLRQLFPERWGDWTAWQLEAFPVINEIVFTNAERTTASVEVNIADTWGTVELEKESGLWIARRVVNFRIS